MGYKGYNAGCRTDLRKEKAAKQREKQSIRSLVLLEENIKLITGGSELQRWFENRHKEMTGFCKHCGGKTQKGQLNYKCSIAHILPKAYFKSVATHPDNNIELCFYGNSCHTNFDNHMIDLIDLNCFDEVVTKFVRMYPSIAQEEKRRIPNIFLQYVEVER